MPKIPAPTTAAVNGTAVAGANAAEELEDADAEADGCDAPPALPVRCAVAADRVFKAFERAADSLARALDRCEAAEPDS